MWVCLYCGDYFKPYRETCPFCGSEGVEAVQDEDEW